MFVVFIGSKGATQILISFWSFNFPKASCLPAVIWERWITTLDLKSPYFVYAVIVICLYFILDSKNNEFCELKFFTALETIVEIANMRSSLLHSFHQLHPEVQDTKEWKSSNSSGIDNLNSPYFICLLLPFWLRTYIELCWRFLSFNCMSRL